MNPKLTVTVDAKNRALATASGMVTVGAKVDVVVIGLPDGIPEWGEGDAFTGTSLRLRLVDECGNDLVRYPLVEGDAWHSESETLSTATPVEFDTDALRRAFCGVAFSEARDFGLVLDSAVDDAQYAVGRIKIRQWAAASTEDPTVLPDWRETLAELRTNLAAVKDERIAAERARTAAETAAGNAADSERTAATSANSAQTAQNAARTSELAAATSATAAETAQNAARASELAAAKAADAAKAAQEGAEKAESETGVALAAHMNDRGNPHAVTKAQVGLGNVDDTSDAAKPISDATRAALDGLDAKLGAKADATDLSRIEAALQDKPDRVELAAKADLVEGKVPAAQLPSYVDDVLEYANLAAFPTTGESGKIYVALDTNLTYRWSGSVYVEISPSPDLTPYAKQADLDTTNKRLERTIIAVGDALSKSQKAATAADAAKTKADDAGNAASAASNAIVSHEEDHNNPHAVTASQVGAQVNLGAYMDVRMYDDDGQRTLMWIPCDGFDLGDNARVYNKDGKIIVDMAGTRRLVLATTDDLSAKLDTTAYSKDMVGITRMIKANENAIADLAAKVDAANARLEAVA